MATGLVTADKTSSRVSMIVFPTIIVLFLVTMIMRDTVWNQWKLYRARQRFERTSGVITSSEIKDDRPSPGSYPRIRPIVRYHYAVQNRQYVSDRYTFGNFDMLSGFWAYTVAHQYRPGQHVEVYFDPSDPAESVLNIEGPPIDYRLLVVIQPFVLIGLWLLARCVALPWQLAREKRFFASKPPSLPDWFPGWGRVRGTPEALSIVSVSRSLGILRGFALASGGICFVSIFALFALTSADGKPEMPLRILGISTLIGIAGAVRAMLHRPAVLRLDRTMNMLELASSRRHLQIRLGELAAWRVRLTPTPNRLKRKGEGSLAPLLAVSTRDGQIIPVHFFRANDLGRDSANQSARLLAGVTGSSYEELRYDPAGPGLGQLDATSADPGNSQSDII